MRKAGKERRVAYSFRTVSSVDLLLVWNDDGSSETALAQTLKERGT